MAATTSTARPRSPETRGFVDGIALACSLVGLPLCCLPWIRRAASAGPEWLRPLGPSSHGSISALVVLVVLAGFTLAAIGAFLGARSRRQRRHQGVSDSRITRWALFVGLAGLAACLSYEVVILVQQWLPVSGASSW